MNGVIARIALRYIAGFLVAKGLLTADFGGSLAADVDALSIVEAVVGAGIVAGTEGW